jgi:ELWxxDGT repeat protein
VQYTETVRRHPRSPVTALLLLFGTFNAFGADTYNGTSLSIPAVTIGSASFANMVVTPANIVSVRGGPAAGSLDSYNPASTQLTIPAVTFGANSYTNVLITVRSLVSVGSVTGADTYKGGYLNIPSVQFLGGPVYTNVVVAIGSILSTGGGMPQRIRDTYNPVTHQLTVSAAQIGGKVYTNAILTLGPIVSVGGSLPALPLLFTDNAGLWSLNESTGQLTKIAAGGGDVNGVALQAGALAVTGGKAYFAGGDPNNPLSLYVSNGAVGGTTLLRAFAAGSGTSQATLADFTALSDGSAVFVYFASDGSQTLWMTNGSSVTEVMLASTGAPYINTSGAFPSVNLGPGQSGEIDGKLIFTDSTGLWSLNESTGQVTELAAGSADVNGVGFQAGSLAVTGGKAYFAGGDPNNPLSLYVSNGAAGGTTLLRAFAAGSGTSQATLADFTALASGSALFVYFASDGSQTLWMTNGSSVTEVMLASTGAPYTNTSGVFPAINLGPGQSGEIQGHLLFTDNAGLWSLNESTGQVAELLSIIGDVNGVGFQAGSLAVTGGKAYFAGGDANNPLGVYASDGTAAGTILVGTFGQGSGDSLATLADFTPLANGGALFAYYASDGSESLWTTFGDGTTEVTLAGSAAPYSNTSGAFPSINLGAGQSAAL